jgi:hypothetical protein
VIYEVSLVLFSGWCWWPPSYCCCSRRGIWATPVPRGGRRGDPPLAVVVWNIRNISSSGSSSSMAVVPISPQYWLAICHWIRALHCNFLAKGPRLSCLHNNICSFGTFPGLVEFDSTESEILPHWHFPYCYCRRVGGCKNVGVLKYNFCCLLLRLLRNTSEPSFSVLVACAKEAPRVRVSSPWSPASTPTAALTSGPYPSTFLPKR